MSFYEDLKESLEQTVTIHNECQLAEEVKIAEQQLPKAKAFQTKRHEKK